MIVRFVGTIGGIVDHHCLTFKRYSNLSLEI
jgi:hypothetical protein